MQHAALELLEESCQWAFLNPGGFQAHPCLSFPSHGGFAPSMALTLPACTPPVVRHAPPNSYAPNTTTLTCTWSLDGCIVSSDSFYILAAVFLPPSSGWRCLHSSACSTSACEFSFAFSTSCPSFSCCWVTAGWTSASSMICLYTACMLQCFWSEALDGVSWSL